MQHFSPRRSLPSRRKIVSLFLSFLAAVAAFGLGIGVVYATVTISENIQLGSGTPDLTLDGDDLYVTGTLETDGAARFDGTATFNATSTFSSANRVGIGTTSPSRQLHISSELPDNAYLRMSGRQTFIELEDRDASEGKHAMDIAYNNGVLFFRALNDDFSWNSDILTLDNIQTDPVVNVRTGDFLVNTGSVGIGDNDPDAHLEVSASGGTGGDIFYLSSDDDNDGDLLTVTEAGLVGIGTASPSSTLHVPDGKYAQFEDNNAGAPPSADCDADAERGRLSIDTTNNRLYICNGASRGWDFVALTD